MCTFKFMKYFITLITITFFLSAQSQDTNYVDPNYKPEKQKSRKPSKGIGDRVYYGGTFGLSFGTFTSILVEPLVGFKMTEKLSTGIGIGFRYGKDNRTNSNLEYTNYLGRFYARYIIIPRVYAHVEYMVESYDESFYFEGQSINKTGRTVVPFLFVGGGLRSPAGNGSFIVQILFNVLQSNSNSNQVYPSGSPYISIGYIGGF